MSSPTGPTDARPLKVRISDDIRARIEAGSYPAGSRLPTLDTLASEYMCSLAAVRDALDLLRQQGLVITKQGLGSFVRERAKARRHGIERYSRSRWGGASGKAVLIAEGEAQGRNVQQLIRELGEVPASTAVAARLGVSPGEAVWVRRRLTLIDSRPNQLADSYYKLSLVDIVPMLREENTGPGGGFARIEEAGVRLAEIAEELAARMPTGPETITLRLPEGTPVVELMRTTYDLNGQPVEVMHAVIAGDMAEFAYRFPIPD
ncbi:GntR family transcriptional regulator [Protofrankia symbiont of Coriaria ruscifolia]|uniref:GntR family transcriptional regulator n=1 Tax=Protofrankia symbiont of Coriaria ruscifolia TaxID=1306542 RepID=UPI001A953A1A|nr:GntR family transcriptional regulator [Protofrankia symbiont of Coriaria ruscifolia]